MAVAGGVGVGEHMGDCWSVWVVVVGVVEHICMGSEGGVGEGRSGGRMSCLVIGMTHVVLEGSAPWRGS